MAMPRHGAVCGFENVPSFDLQLVMPQFVLRDCDGMAEGIWGDVVEDQPDRQRCGAYGWWAGCGEFVHCPCFFGCLRAFHDM